MKTTMDLFNKVNHPDYKDVVHNFMDNCEGLFHAPTGTDNCVLHTEQYGVLLVGIDHPDKLCNLMEEVPNIRILATKEGEIEVLRLTWKEARQLCAVLWQITNIAEFG